MVVVVVAAAFGSNIEQMVKTTKRPFNGFSHWRVFATTISQEEDDDEELTKV